MAVNFFTMFVIDGSKGEGGGQIMRTALALSVLLGKPVRLFNIRRNRPQPGLKPQHMESVRAIATISDARVEGLHPGSVELTFIPRKPKCGRYRFGVSTAGSITLMIQTIFPVLALCEGYSAVELEGGTDVPFSPLFDYMRLVFLPIMERMGVRARLKLIRRGHYPRGGGRAILEVWGVDRLNPIRAEFFGKPLKVDGKSHCTNLPSHVASRQIKGACNILEKLNVPCEIEEEVSTGSGKGSGIVVRAISNAGQILGADSLGKPGKRAEVVGREAGRKLREYVEKDCGIDPHMGDMIIPYMALAEGKSIITTCRLTGHIETNLWVVQEMTGVLFRVHGREPVRIEVVR